MMQLEIPLSHRTDPQTSYDAAEKARTFKARHVALIWNKLRELHGHGQTPYQLSRLIGLDYIAVQRRGAEMERKGLIVRGPDKRDGQLIWRIS